MANRFLVASPLLALMSDQLSSLKNKRPELPVVASVVNRAEEKNSDKLSFGGMPDYQADVRAGLAEIVFAHPDSRGLSLLAAENADL